MKLIRIFTRTLAAAAVGLTVGAATGCEEQRAAIVQAYPQTGPYIGGRPKPTPFETKVGNIRGFVYGADGPKQPIPLAFVSTGSISAFAGNPQEAAVEEEEIDDGRTISVYHDFNDGAGPVLSERRPRKRAIDDEDPFVSKYVYLRSGEFFLEGVPEGIATLRSSFGGVDSSSNKVTVYANTTVTDVALNLYLPIPVANEDQSVPRVVEWTGLQPETGITTQIEPKTATDSSGGASSDNALPTVTYRPDPPDVAIELKSPPGSGGTVIRSVSIAYVYTTVGGVRKSVLIDPPIPISPVVIPAAQATSFGPPAIITVPVGSKTINRLYDADDPPNGVVVANMRFLDEQGFEVQGKLLDALEASVVLRAL